VGDTYTINEDTSLSASSVLANDSDLHGGTLGENNLPLAAELVTLPTNADADIFKFNPDGTFTYMPAGNFNGTDSFAYRAVDSRGGKSEPVTVLIMVNAVNDVPSFVKGPDQTVVEDAGPQSVTDWGTSISAGPSDESAQVVDFVVSNNNNALFSAQPVLLPNGTLAYTAADNAHGVALVTVQLRDSGGTSHGGGDTSAEQTFFVTVNPVNDDVIGQDPDKIEERTDGGLTALTVGTSDVKVTWIAEPGTFSAATAVVLETVTQPLPTHGSDESGEPADFSHIKAAAIALPEHPVFNRDALIVFKVIMSALPPEMRAELLAALLAEEATLSVVEPGEDPRALPIRRGQAPAIDFVDIAPRDAEGKVVPVEEAARIVSVDFSTPSRRADAKYALSMVKSARQNAPPTPVISGPTAGVPGQPLQFSLTATDPDATAPLRFRVEWGDGAVDLFEGNASQNISREHAYRMSGSYQVSVSANDGQDTVSAVSPQVTITQVLFSGGRLAVGGTPGSDAMQFLPGPNATTRVRMGTRDLGNFAVPANGTLVGYGGEGNDVLSVASAIRQRAILDGGTGIDVLYGGGGPTVLVGGEGTDVLWGGTGRNVLIGGGAADLLYGGANEDLLIAGTTDYDDDLLSLLAVSSIWNSSANYNTRVSNLSEPQSPTRLDPSTVLDDNSLDLLIGSSGRDLFFANYQGANVRDVYTKESNETQIDI
jgi:Ca2+-binding RTX toxin-like protein